MDRSEWGDDDAEPTSARRSLRRTASGATRPSSGSGFVAATPTSAPAADPGSKGPVMLVAVAAGVLLLVATGVSVRMLGDRTPPRPARGASRRPSQPREHVGDDDTHGGQCRHRCAGSRPRSRGASARATPSSSTSSTMVTTMAAVAASTTLAALLPDGRRLDGQAARQGRPLGHRRAQHHRRPAPRRHAPAAPSPLHAGDTALDGRPAGDPGTISALGRHTTSPDGSKLHHVMQARHRRAQGADEGRPSSTARAPWWPVHLGRQGRCRRHPDRPRDVGGPQPAAQRRPPRPALDRRERA